MDHPFLLGPARRRELAQRFGCVALAGLALLGCGEGRAAVPTRAPIVMDGVDEDWSEVLVNPLNTARDGDGTAIDCPLSDDRDCDVNDGAADLARLAWTWSVSSLFLYVERREADADRELLVYLDSDGDGLMSSFEPVLVVLMPRNGGPGLPVTSYLYLSSEPAGDAIADASGLADGHDMPGTLTGGGVPVGEAWPIGDPPLALEIEVSWEQLGLSGDPPVVGFHASSADGLDVPSKLKDNMGGPNGAAGSTGFRALSLEAPRTLGAAAGQTVDLGHAVRNEGNRPTRVNLTVVSSIGQDLHVWRDVDADGMGDDFLGFDVGGDGLWSLPGDELAPEGDGNADGRLDTGVLAPAESFAFTVRLDLAPGSEGVTDQLVLTASQHEAPGVRAVNEDVLQVGALTIQPDVSRVGAPGGLVWLPHVVRNNTAADRVVDLSVFSGLGWTYDAFRDPGADGDPGDAEALIDQNADGRPDVVVEAGALEGLLLRARVPGGVPLGTEDFALVVVEADGVTQSVVTDRVSVAEPIGLEPSHLFAAGRAKYGSAGRFIYFPHRLENAMSEPQVFDLSAVSDVGWTVTLMDDPDGDGRPFDATALAEPSLTVPENGGSRSLIVRLAVPELVPIGTMATIDVQAATRSDPVAVATARDEAVVSIVQVYEDETHVVNASVFAPCSTVHAQASGLPPAMDELRFVWRDGESMVVRTREVATGLDGTCSDALELEAGMSADGASVSIQEWDGDAWVDVDTASYQSENAVSARDLEVDPAVLSLAGGLVSASVEIANDAAFGSSAAVDVRWVLLSPDRSEHLRPEGTFAPYSGSEATAVESLELEPLGSRRLDLAVAVPGFLQDGVHVLEVLLSEPCGGELLGAEGSLLVLDDPDGDGLDTAEELAAGTDPNDADTDDDGLLDADDGLGDSDGDGTIDALDCDSDGDGLPDGLEAGVAAAPADTDPSAGCFTPDLAPSSTTDPDVRDTDGGGVPDGLEDVNGNGRLDAGETDPRDASDDPPCDLAAPPEVLGLVVTKIEGGAARLEWDAAVLDDCSGFVILASEAGVPSEPIGPPFSEQGAVDAGGLGPGGLRHYLVVIESAVAGRGPTGR